MEELMLTYNPLSNVIKHICVPAHCGAQHSLTFMIILRVSNMFPHLYLGRLKMRLYQRVQLVQSKTQARLLHFITKVPQGRLNILLEEK